MMDREILSRARPLQIKVYAHYSIHKTQRARTTPQLGNFQTIVVYIIRQADELD